MNMTQLFIGPIIANIINTCLDYLKDQLFGQTSMKEALERLQKRLPIIRSVISAYYQAQIIGEDPALDGWIWQLRDAIDEADDLLDEFEYMKHKKEISKNTEETKNKNVFSNTNFLLESAHEILKVGERALKLDPNMKRLEEVVQNLDKVSAEVSTFLYLLESTKQKQQEQQLELYKTRETGSLPGNDLIGRGKDKKSVMRWLRKKSHSNQKQKTHITSTLYKNISLLSIVGHGGMGKTTLLQHVYEEITKEFDLKMWVCVSNDFDVKKVISDMLESLKKKRPRAEALHTLQESLKSEVMSKKFLLVLDDIWEEEKEEQDKRKWESVFAPLAYGRLGSKILVTTRMDSVASMIAKVIKKKKETFMLEGLKENECLQLLNNHAFADVENPDDHKKLKVISGEIVKKLSGSPLAAKVIGGILSSNFDEEHWRKVLTSDFGSQNDIFSIIRLSYTFLSIPLQTCFAFCSVFSQDYKFDKEDLVRMWIALGFIQMPSTSRENLEDIGGKYFDTLVKKSFFDKFENEDITWYKMHDLLYELARSISAQECFRVVDDEELFFKIPDTIRHLSLTIKNLDVLKKMRKLKNLRSLFLTCDNYNQNFVVPTEIFEASRSIRLLYINGLSIKMIPEAIIHLIHLGYLKIYETAITQLPRSISHLYHLQFIIHKTSYRSEIQDDFLPRDINNLSNLHYLKFLNDKFPAICGIGKLKYLQELEGFYVKNEVGYIIEELKHMNDLRHLKIKFLENVKDAEEACSAKFCDKKNLKNLSLEWGDNNGYRNIVVPDLDEKLLDNIQPHNNLKKLIINGYMGVRPAIWMNKAHFIHNLEYIELDECLEWQNLPPFGQLPFLKSLSLRDMPKVKRLDNKFHGNDMYCVFPSLEVLLIYRLEALEDWFDSRVTATDDCLFPCLTELYLKSCPNLKELPYFPPKLEILEIIDVGWKTLNFYSISRFISLETLMISRCPNITYILLADEIARLAALKKLIIKGCPNLISLGEHQVKTIENSKLKLHELFIDDPLVLQMEPLRSITSLQELTIEENDELVSFSIETEQWFLQLRSPLRKMTFGSLKSLQSLPSSLESLSTLKILTVSNVPQLQRLPNIPNSLETLNLYDLESLQCLPSSLPTISSLKDLTLRIIPLLKSLPDLPPSLQSLHLDYLDDLESIYSLSSLNSLLISSAPRLRELPGIPPSLQSLYLDCLDNLESISSLSSLNILFIVSVPRLRELPDLPSTLSSLSIFNCHPELMERYEKISSSDWHTIAHILNVHISS